jgi:hypothetical protein
MQTLWIAWSQAPVPDLPNQADSLHLLVFGMSKNSFRLARRRNHHGDCSSSGAGRYVLEGELSASLPVAGVNTRTPFRLKFEMTVRACSEDSQSNHARASCEASRTR